MNRNLRFLILILANMISLLIPVYNDIIIDLVTNLHHQLKLSEIEYEIICLDDKSDSRFIQKNKMVEQFDHVTYKLSDKNNGRTKTRQQLAQIAKYDWLLFLDSDVLPKSEHFILNYIDFLNKEYDAIFGGFAYEAEVPDVNYRLRWKYGINQEQKSALIRNKRPYKVIISANFLVKKALFLSINANVEGHNYGLDNIFGAELKQRNTKVLHIDNEVYHLGIEPSETYLKKKEDSALTVLKHYKLNKVNDHQNDLLSLFVKSKRYKLNYLFSLTYKVLGNALRKNLIGKNPSIKLLQLYRICFMCHKDLNPQ